MAGSWLKVRHDLEDAPELRRIARATGIDRDAVLGKLFRVWSWFDRHSAAGRLEAVELEDLDDRVACPGFAAAMLAVGWLEQTAGGLEIPHWERHNGESAKSRALAQARMARARYAPRATDCADDVTEKPVPEESRGEESRNPPPPPREADESEQAALRDAWQKAAALRTVKPWKATALPPDAHRRLAEPGWLAEAAAALEHLPRCRFFRTPVNLEQFCATGFTGRVIGGAYDDVAQPRATTSRAAETAPPPKPWKASELEAFERTRRNLAAATGANP